MSAVSFVQEAYSPWQPTTTGSVTVTLSSAPTPGNTLVAISVVQNVQEFQESAGLPADFTVIDQAAAAGSPENPYVNPNVGATNFFVIEASSHDVASGDGTTYVFTGPANTQASYGWGVALFELAGVGSLDFRGGGGGSNPTSAQSQPAGSAWTYFDVEAGDYVILTMAAFWQNGTYPQGEIWQQSGGFSAGWTEHNAMYNTSIYGQAVFDRQGFASAVLEKQMWSGFFVNTANTHVPIGILRAHPPSSTPSGGPGRAQLFACAE